MRLSEWGACLNYRSLPPYPFGCKVAQALTGDDIQSPTPKNDFCRMFIREGLLDVGDSPNFSHDLGLTEYLSL